MQCSMRNKYSSLIICIMNYLHVLCMIFMVLSCVLCMTLMIFIYMYYRLFIYKNLVYVMLFFTIFSFHLLIFDKKSAGFQKKKSIISGAFQSIFSDFYRILKKTMRSITCDFYSSQNFRPLAGGRSVELL
jgi:hypothetical protein